VDIRGHIPVKIVKNTLLLVTLIVGVLCTACKFGTHTEYIGTYGGKDVPAGIYVMYELVDGLYFAMQKLMEKDKNFYPQIGSHGDLYEKVIDGVTVEELVMQKAQENTVMHIAINVLFAELNLELPAEKRDRLEQSAKVYGKQKAAFSQNGVGLDSYVAFFETKEKKQMLFDYYYGENGVAKPSEEELLNKFNESFVKLQTETFYYGANASEEDKAKMQKKAQEFQKRAQTDGFSETLIKDREEEQKRTSEVNKKADEPAKEVNETEGLGPVIEENAMAEALKLIEATSITIMDDKQMGSFYTESGKNEIKKRTEGEIILLDIPSQHMFVVLQVLPKTKEEQKEKEQQILEFLKTDEFERKLFERGKKEGFEFNMQAVDKFRPTRLKMR
jgi:hypothetical protein